jgi:glycosyltransferase involved in cell wall biosynthesis
MKIIFVSREGYNLSGARVRCYNFAQELGKYGIETEVFSFADDLGAKYGDKEFQMDVTQKIKYNISAFKSLRKKINNNSIIFMQRLNYHSLAPFFVSLLRKNRFIFDCDDWNIRENPVYYLGIYPSSKMEYLTRQIARYSDVCIAASRFLEEYISKFNSNIHYIPTGVDTDMFKPRNNNIGKTKITFSWIGTAYHKEMRENIEFLLDAFLILANKYDNIFLDFVGEGKYFTEIKDGLGNFRYRDKVRFCSWISPEQIPDYLSNIDVGLLPLIQDTKFNKAKSPTKLFEYMAMAKPTICSDIGEASHIIQDGENGLLAKTKEEFIEKMQSLIEDLSLRQSLGARARETVERNYSLKTLGKQLSEILNTI